MTELQIPEELRKLVSQVGDPVTSDQLAIYEKLQGMSDKSYKLRTIVNAWEGQNTEERRMRRGFGIAIIVALFIQIIVINAAFFLIGANKITVTQWVANTFIISVFTEIVSMTLLVLRYLFPKVGSDVMKLIENL